MKLIHSTIVVVNSTCNNLINKRVSKRLNNDIFQVFYFDSNMIFKSFRAELEYKFSNSIYYFYGKHLEQREVFPVLMTKGWNTLESQ